MAISRSGYKHAEYITERIVAKNLAQYFWPPRGWQFGRIEVDELEIIRYGRAGHRQFCYGAPLIVNAAGNQPHHNRKDCACA